MKRFTDDSHALYTVIDYQINGVLVKRVIKVFLFTITLHAKEIRK